MLLAQIIQGAKCKLEGRCRNEDKMVNEEFDEPDGEVCNLLGDLKFVKCGNNEDEKITVTFSDKDGKQLYPPFHAWVPKRYQKFWADLL